MSKKTTTKNSSEKTYRFGNHQLTVSSQYTAEEVKTHWATIFPELAQCDTEVQGEEIVFVKRRVSTKGNEKSNELYSRLEQIFNGEDDAGGLLMVQVPPHSPADRSLGEAVTGDEATIWQEHHPKMARSPSALQFGKPLMRLVFIRETGRRFQSVKGRFPERS